MNTFSKSTQIYCKTAEDGLLAHVYEHIAAKWIDGYMSEQGQFLVVDYSLWGHTYGQTTFLETIAYNSSARRTLQKALSLFESEQMTMALVEQAAQECSCEYKRKLESVNDDFVQQVIQLHKNDWGLLEDFEVDHATDETSVNTLFASGGIRYDKPNENSFARHFIQFDVPVTVYAAEPAMKALAVLVTQALALNTYRRLEQICTIYDEGDAWAEGNEEVGYRIYFSSVVNGSVDAAFLEAVAKKFRDSLRQTDFAKNATQLVKAVKDDSSLSYFETARLNQILGGIVVGGKAWESVAKAVNVDKILETTRITSEIAE